MDELSADEARRNWRELLECAHFRDEHVGITRNGKPWVVVVSVDWHRRMLALRNAVYAFTHDSDGRRVPGESELPVGELLRLIGDAAIDGLE